MVELENHMFVNGNHYNKQLFDLPRSSGKFCSKYIFENYAFIKCKSV